MIEKVTTLLAFLALAKAGTIATHFNPSTSVSTAYSPITNKVIATPAPIYEEDVSIQETNINSVDRVGQDYYKSRNTIYPDSRNFHTYINNYGAILTQNIPSTYNQPTSGLTAYNPTYTLSSPLTAKTVSGPITYTTHTHSTPFEKLRSPFMKKTTGLTYNPHAPLTQKKIITFAEAPVVSHMTFRGFGATYTW